MMAATALIVNHYQSSMFAGQCLWTAEAMNIEKMFGSKKFNRWKRGRSSNDRVALTYLISAPIQSSYTTVLQNTA